MMDFLELLYSIKIQRNSEDVIWWTPTCSRVFEVKSSYKELSIRGSMSFPWKSIWNTKLPTKVAFFVWTAALGNILTVDNLHRHHIIIVDWCCMCKQWGISGSLITSLWYGLWSLVFVLCLFGVQWVMSQRVVELLSSWRGRFTRHRNGEIWSASPLCVMWILWKEQNSHTFEDIERTLVELKLFLHFFIMSGWLPLHFLIFWDFIDPCNFSWFLLWGTPIVYSEVASFLINFLIKKKCSSYHSSNLLHTGKSMSC